MRNLVRQWEGIREKQLCEFALPKWNESSLEHSPTSESTVDS